jgi:hypothetical protein
MLFIVTNENAQSKKEGESSWNDLSNGSVPDAYPCSAAKTTD